MENCVIKVEKRYFPMSLEVSALALLKEAHLQTQEENMIKESQFLFSKIKFFVNI